MECSLLFQKKINPSGPSDWMIKYSKEIKKLPPIRLWDQASLWHQSAKKVSSLKAWDYPAEDLERWRKKQKGKWPEKPWGKKRKIVS